MIDKIKPDQLAAAVHETLQTFAEATGDQLADTIKKTANETARIVRQNALTFGENYAKDIKARHFKDTRKKGGRKISEYVTAGPHYRVAHLLENGHAIVRGGRTVGFVEGRPHWKQGEEYLQNNFVPNLKRAIEEESRK